MIIWQVKLNGEPMGSMSTQTRYGVYAAMLDYLPVAVEGRADFTYEIEDRAHWMQDDKYRAILHYAGYFVTAESLEVVNG